MNFGRYLHTLTVLMILTGFYSILITGGYPTAVGIGFAVTGLYWYAGERITKWIPVPRGVWNALAVGYFLLLTYDTFFGEQDLIGNGIKFVIYLQAVKLLSPKTTRDWLQIYLLSFLHLLSSTVLTDDISFAVPFLIYIVLATWALTMFNLKTEVGHLAESSEKPFLVESLLRSKDVITRNFLALTSILSITIIAFTLLVFFVFPRVSMGNFLKRVSGGQHVSGFSEKVELGTIGTIKTNDKIVIRVELPAELDPAIRLDELYWRATASDAFDGRSWSQTMEGRANIRAERGSDDGGEPTTTRDSIRRNFQLDPDTGILSIRTRTYPGGKLFSYRIFLEAFDPPILFAADRPQRMIWDQTLMDRLFRGVLGLQADSYSGIYFLSQNRLASDLTYRVESIVGDVDASELRIENAEDVLPHYVREYYLQLPTLHPDVENIFRSIPMPEHGTFDRVQAVVDYLETNYRYTLDVQDRGTKDPLRFFLVERKRGHCEYFSTALAMALRFHGIPARNAVGFRGGELNEYGNYLAVRQRDAHSWTEVYFPRFGWMRFDPSPPDATVVNRIDWMTPFYQYVDFLRLRWNKYIIEYDLRSQVAFAERIGAQLLKALRKSPGKSTPTSQKSPDTQNQLTSTPWIGTLILWLTVGVLIFGLLRGLRQYRKSRKAEGLYGDLLRLLKRHKIERHPAETAGELCARAEEKFARIPSLIALIRLYEASRFGGEKLDSPTWDALLAKLTDELRRQEQKEHPSNRPKASRKAA